MTTDDWPEPTGYFTLHDLAYIHGTTEAEVLRVVVEVLGLPPKDRFDSQEFLRRCGIPQAGGVGARLWRSICPVRHPVHGARALLRR